MVKRGRLCNRRTKLNPAQRYYVELYP